MSEFQSLDTLMRSRAECVHKRKCVCVFLYCMCVLILYTVQKDFLSIMRLWEWCICDRVMLCGGSCCRFEWQREWLEPIILLHTPWERHCGATELTWHAHVAQDFRLIHICIGVSTDTCMNTCYIWTRINVRQEGICCMCCRKHLLVLFKGAHVTLR